MTSAAAKPAHVTLFWLIFAVTRLAAQQTAPPMDYQLSIGFSGDIGPEDGLNPATVLYRRWPRAGTLALGYINYRHQSSLHQIAAAADLTDSATMSLLAALDSCGLIHRDSTGYRVTFAVFDDEVWAAFEPVITLMAARIRARVTAEVLPILKTVYDSSRVAARGTPYAVAGPVLVAALGLDERAIQLLERQGLVHIRLPHPGGRMYGVLAQLSNRSGARAQLWGIHGMGLPGVMFEVFGDNGVMNQRRGEIDALPDLAWAWRSAGRLTPGKVDSLVGATATLAIRFGNSWFDRDELADSERAPLGDLVRAGLIETQDSSRWRLSFPVIEAADVARFEPFIAQIGQIAVDAMVEYEPRLEAAYERTTPAANSVPLAEALNLVYHTSYSRAFEAILGEQSFRFARELGALRYTGYAIRR